MLSNNTPTSGIPADTFQAARQMYNLESIYLRIGDRFDELFVETDLELLDPSISLSSELVSRLCMVTAFQYAEFLPDPVAYHASRKRVDWKYALRLPIHHQGVPSNSLCVFRQGLFSSTSAQQAFDRFLKNLQKVGLFVKTPPEDLSTGAVLDMVCQITQLHGLYIAIKEALVVVAASEPQWLVENMPPYWYTRYKTGPLGYPSLMNAEDLEAEAVKIGADMHLLLTALQAHHLTRILEQVEIQQVARLLESQFSIEGDSVSWRKPVCASCVQRNLGNR